LNLNPTVNAKEKEKEGLAHRQLKLKPLNLNKINVKDLKDLKDSK